MYGMKFRSSVYSLASRVQDSAPKQSSGVRVYYGSECTQDARLRNLEAELLHKSEENRFARGEGQREGQGKQTWESFREGAFMRIVRKHKQTASSKCVFAEHSDKSSCNCANHCKHVV